MLEDIKDDWLPVDHEFEELDVSILGDTHPFELMSQHKDYQPDQRHMLFVYGSMKRGFPNHDRISGSDGNEYIMFSATSDGNFIMGSRTSTAGIVVPMVMQGHGGSYDIYGELYDIDGPTLLNIDLAEGYPIIYKRKLVSVFLNGERSVANIYLFSEYFNPGVVYDRVMTYNNKLGQLAATQEFVSIEEYVRE